MSVVLNAHVADIEWDETPLEEVFDWLAEQGDINVVVVWRALEAEGISPDYPVTLRLRNAKVSSILTEALNQVAEGDDLRYHGIGDTIRISTRSDFNRKLYVRVYNAGDLVFRVPQFKGPSIDLAGGGTGGGGGGGGGTTGGTLPNFQEPEPFTDEGNDDDDAGQDDQARMQELVDLIRETVNPEDWVEAGGRNTIRYWKKMIIVRAPIEVHEKIGGPFVIHD